MNDNVEKALIWALNSFSPSSVLKSESLRLCFIRFFERGTIEDCSQLVPQKHRPPSLPSQPSQPPPSPPVQPCPSKSPLLPLPSQPPSSPPVQPYPSESPSLSLSSSAPLLYPKSSLRTYFENLVGTDENNLKRVNRLVQAADGFSKAEQLELSCYEQLWATKTTSIFNQNESEPSPNDSTDSVRIPRLFQGDQNISDRSTEYQCAGRFTSIFIAYEVEQMALSRHLILAQGQGRKTAAYNKIAQILSLTADLVRARDKRSRNYIRLIQNGGPRSLLELGQGTDISNLWENHLTIDDVNLLLQFREQYLPVSDKCADKLNLVASKTILRGLAAYGWSYPELARRKSVLMGVLGKHVDFKQLALGTIEPLISSEALKSVSQRDRQEYQRKRPQDANDIGTAKRRHYVPSEPDLFMTARTSNERSHPIHRFSEGNNDTRGPTSQGFLVNSDDEVAYDSPSNPLLAMDEYMPSQPTDFSEISFVDPLDIPLSVDGFIPENVTSFQPMDGYMPSQPTDFSGISFVDPPDIPLSMDGLIPEDTLYTPPTNDFLPMDEFCIPPFSNVNQLVPLA
ncbi:MAG: hypothetical protein M1834_007171 [Cirrosporium novae-zelandiae]|nr:MAG: hypothetical protein M1834_007171 [Cirrosporium novae-zelandiae]